MCAGSAFNTDVAEVVAFDQGRRDIGSCDTCSYTETFVRIWYRTTSGTTETYDYVGDLGELIRVLTD